MVGQASAEAGTAIVRGTVGDQQVEVQTKHVLESALILSLALDHVRTPSGP